MGRNTRSSLGRARVAALWDATKVSFGAPAAVAMLAGVVLGVGLPALDKLFDVTVPTISFRTEDAARGLLETVATVTVSVAGLAFSVTIVAFTLASSQLSPRVLRSFRSDRVSQATFALLLATAVYCLTLLVRLGARGSEGVPNLSVTVALGLALASFLLFAVFVGHIARMLQPSSVIATIAGEAREVLRDRFPSGVGAPPERGDAARARARARTERSSPFPVEAGDDGYLGVIDGDRVMAVAARCDALIVQRAALGDYVISTQPLADVYADELDDDDAAELRAAFGLGRQRSLVQDVAFPVRQLADIAARGLSPGVNDPTTSENAMDAMAAVLVRLAGADQPPEVRVDEEGEPRFVANVPDLDDLVRLGFEQVRIFAAPYPVVTARLLLVLSLIGDAASAAGVDHAEVDRQAALLREGPDGNVPTREDVDGVRRAYARLHTREVL
jgi:uncharacterized membrane protein